MSQRISPYVQFPGVQYCDELFPHIWTSNKQFSIDFIVPFSNNGTIQLQTKLFGLPRSKANETKYSKNLENDIEDQDLVEIEETTLLPPCSDYLTTDGNNWALFTLYNRVEFSILFDLSRNHWERAKKEKFMMFVMKCMVNERYSCNIRIYAQKTTPAGFMQANQDSFMYMAPITSRFIPKRPIIPSDDQLPSPESDSSSEEEKKGERKRRYDDIFVIDTSPLPQELIRMWSNSEGLKLFMSALQPLMNAPAFCVPGECMQSNSFDVQFVEKRIRVE